jgi:hypothetical protein
MPRARASSELGLTTTGFQMTTPRPTEHCYIYTTSAPALRAPAQRRVRGGSRATPLARVRLARAARVGRGRRAPGPPAPRARVRGAAHGLLAARLVANLPLFQVSLESQKLGGLKGRGSHGTGAIPRRCFYKHASERGVVQQERLLLHLIEKTAKNFAQSVTDRLRDPLGPACHFGQTLQAV